MSIANRTAELDAIGETLLQVVRTRTAARQRLAFARVTLAQAERECSEAEANAARAEQQQRVLLAQSEVQP